jgi:hypothetical protein
MDAVLRMQVEGLVRVKGPLHHRFRGGPPPSAGIPPAHPRRRNLDSGSARSGEEL